MMTEQKPKVKKPIFYGFMRDAGGGLVAGFSEKKWVVWFRSRCADAVAFARSLRKIGNIAQNNYELGMKHYARGNFSDAIWRLALVTAINPNHAEAWLGLGKSHLAAHNKPSARRAIARAIALKPNWPDALDTLANAQSAPHGP